MVQRTAARKGVEANSTENLYDASKEKLLKRRARDRRVRSCYNVFKQLCYLGDSSGKFPIEFESLLFIYSRFMRFLLQKTSLHESRKFPRLATRLNASVTADEAVQC